MTLQIGFWISVTLDIANASRGAISTNAKHIVIREENIIFDDICEFIKGNGEIKNLSLIQDDEKNNIRKIYVKGKSVEVPIYTGRYFKESDFNGGKPAAIAGDGVSVEKGIHYTTRSNLITIDEVEFDVIGRFGYRTAGSIDHMMIINYNADPNKRRGNVAVIDSPDKKEIEKALMLIQSHFNPLYDGGEAHSHGDGSVHTSDLTAIEELDIKSEGIERLFSNIVNMSGVYVIAILCFVLSSIAISAQWVNNHRKAIAVKRLIGWNNAKLRRELYKKFLFYGLLAIVLAIPVSVGKGIHLILFDPLFMLFVLIGNILLMLLILYPLTKRMFRISVAEALRY